MYSRSRIVAFATAALLSVAAPAAADTIRITSGTLVFPAAGVVPISVELSGDGFTFSGLAAPFDLFFSPYESCLVPACVAGSTLNLRTFGTGSNYRFATATYQGVTFGDLGRLTSANDIYTDWTGTVVFPQGFTGGTLTAPFAFSGTFQQSDFITVTRVNLFGSGTATLTFGPYGAPVHPDAFGTESVRFDFDAAAPTPEPASLLLVATGLAGLVAKLRRVPPKLVTGLLRRRAR